MCRYHSVLAAILLTSLLFSSCTTDKNTAIEENTAAAEESEVLSDAGTETDRSDYPDTLPELDLKGDSIRFLYWPMATGGIHYDLGYEESVDQISDAVITRNMNTEERLNCKLEFINSGTDWAGYLEYAKNAILSASTDFEILHCYHYGFAGLSLQNCYLKLNDMPYLDFEQPWWYVDYLREISFDNESIYFLAGDILQSFTGQMSCMYFNKNLYNNYYDVSELYQTVMDGKWTLDMFAEQAETFYIDLDGNGSMDTTDQLGYGIITGNMTEHLLYCAENQMTTRDENGYPVINPLNDRLLATIDKILALEWENAGGCQFESSNDGLQQIIDSFVEGKSAFKIGWFADAPKLRDMEDDFGIIPYPKYDENQNSYHALVHDAANLLTLPVINTKIEASCAVLESLAADSYRLVVPAYYENTLKVKYSRDDISAEIIDMIRYNTITDFAYIFYSDLNNVGVIARTMAQQKENTVASWWEQNQKTIDNKIESFKESFENMGS